MSVREEDKQKNCPSRGLGLAAAAIGVGVGAALYYFFSKRSENPDSEGSTSQGWNCEQPQALNFEADEACAPDSCNESYITISEHITTDTSINDDSLNASYDGYHFGQSSSVVTLNSDGSDDISRYENSSVFLDSEDNWTCDFVSNDDSSDNDESFERTESLDSDEADNEDSDTGCLLRNNFDSSLSSLYSETDNDWDVTSSSIGVPVITPPRMGVPFITTPNLQDFLRNLSSKKLRQEDRNRSLRDKALMSEEEQIRILREQAFRERSWSLEECSICFEVMLKDQELMALPCTHNFHVACIGPWLQEQQTCPVCRKPAE